MGDRAVLCISRNLTMLMIQDEYWMKQHVFTLCFVSRIISNASCCSETDFECKKSRKPLALEEALRLTPSNINDYLNALCGADLSVQKDKKAIGAEGGAENC